MKHLKNLCKVMLGIYLCFVLISNAAPAPLQVSVTKDDLSSQKELLQMQIDSKKELLQKDIEAQNKRIEALDKRIDDQVSRVSDVGTAVDRFGVNATYICLAITILLLVIGFMSYRTAKNDAKETAEKVARKETSRWLEQNKELFADQKRKIDKELQEAIRLIDLHVKTVKDSSDAANSDIKAMQQQINQTKSESKSSDSEMSSSQAVELLAEEIKKRPESSYSYDDWNTRAFAAYSEAKLEDAAFYWGKAANVPAAGAHNSAQALYNKGVVLDRNGHVKEAVDVYDELMAKFSNDSSSDIQNIVMRTMLNKGSSLIDCESYENAVIECDALISKFDSNSSSEWISKAKANKGFALLCEAKRNWHDQNQVASVLKSAEKHTIEALNELSHNGFVLGNLAYIKWLQKDPVLAKQKFHNGLAAKEHGGLELYESTIKDISRHPIEPDKGFSELVEKLWLEYQQKPKS